MAPGAAPKRGSSVEKNRRNRAGRQPGTGPRLECLVGGPELNELGIGEVFRAIFIPKAWTC
jgi:hypothetical protein